MPSVNNKNLNINTKSKSSNFKAVRKSNSKSSGSKNDNLSPNDNNKLILWNLNALESKSTSSKAKAGNAEKKKRRDMNKRELKEDDAMKQFEKQRKNVKDYRNVLKQNFSNLMKHSNAIAKDMKGYEKNLGQLKSAFLSSLKKGLYNLAQSAFGKLDPSDSKSEYVLDISKTYDFSLKNIDSYLFQWLKEEGERVSNLVDAGMESDEEDVDDEEEPNDGDDDDEEKQEEVSNDNDVDQGLDSRLSKLISTSKWCFENKVDTFNTSVAKNAKLADDSDDGDSEIRFDSQAAIEVFKKTNLIGGSLRLRKKCIVTDIIMHYDAQLCTLKVECEIDEIPFTNE